MSFPGGSDGEESACSVGELGLIPGLGRSSGRGHGNPLQYACLENPHGQRSLVGCSPCGHNWETAQHNPTERRWGKGNGFLIRSCEFCLLGFRTIQGRYTAGELLVPKDEPCKRKLESSGDDLLETHLKKVHLNTPSHPFSTDSREK